MKISHIENFQFMKEKFISNITMEKEMSQLQQEHL